MSPTHRAARAYAERLDWAVFPVERGEKRPHRRFVRHGFQDATRDAVQIDRWWSVDPSAGVAIACAMSGLVVLDVDPRNGGDETLGRLERELGPLPTTPRACTPSGGSHFFFRDEVGHYLGTAGEGLDLKHDGYVVAAPSIHPNGLPYRWDVGAHVLDVVVAGLPDRWLQHVTRQRKAALPSTGIDAAESWLGVAFAHMRWLGDALPDGRRMVRCPWAGAHTDGRGFGEDTSTILFPRAQDRTLGSFRCSHGHCAHRTWHDVLDVLPREAKWAADQAMRRERNRIALEQLAATRRSA